MDLKNVVRVLLHDLFNLLLQRVNIFIVDIYYTLSVKSKRLEQTNYRIREAYANIAINYFIVITIHCYYCSLSYSAAYSFFPLIVLVLLLLYC